MTTTYTLDLEDTEQLDCLVTDARELASALRDKVSTPVGVALADALAARVEEVHAEVQALRAKLADSALGPAAGS